ncbi:zinc-ribbon domain containing protein [bacterium]|nr:zinc-ribbon domain containing protein [bacterium]
MPICQNCHQQFNITQEDKEFYQKIGVPEPTFCPDCRLQRRMAFRNERALYKRKCDLCGKEVVSRVSPDKPYPVYCKECWWSDKWDPLSYGRDYDFNRPFFEQFKELLFSTPHLSILNANVVNSDWVNQESDDKNCYLNVGGHFNEDSAYNTYAIQCKDCFDNFWLFSSELCYECINCNHCYKTLFSQDCFQCRDTILSFDCRNCSNIFGCAGLRYKQYYIFNKPVSKEEYQEFLKNNPLTSYKNLLRLKEKAKKVWISVPHRAVTITKSVNSWGNIIFESKNAIDCWYSEKIEDSKYLFFAGSLRDCYDCSCFGWGELCYEIAHSSGFYNSKFSMFGFGGRADKMGSSNLEYCYAVLTSHNCFGCANMRNQEYCILNKKYSKEEYKSLRKKIIKHMQKMPYKDEKGRVYKYGEFFPIELSPFGYNETAAQDYFPLTKKQAQDLGYPWSDYESKIKYQFSDYKIPDDIKDVNDDILDKILKCEITGKAYKIIPMELDFYRRMGLPIPRRCPLQRHKDRLALLPPRKLYKRKCDKCGKEILTTYSPDRPEIVYCEKCYLKEIG